MKKTLILIGGGVTLFTLALAPLATAGGSGHSPTNGQYTPHVVPAMQVGNTATIVATTPATTFASPLVKAPHH